MTGASQSTAESGRGGRRDDVLEAAATLFAKKGYAATSIRDIADQVGMLSGSLYYHFSSKEAILLEAHARGVAQVTEAVQAAILRSGERPWDRVAAACRAHLQVLLDSSPFSQVITPQFPGNFEGDVRDTLLAQRADYEDLFRELLNALPLPKGMDRRVLRLSLLGALNWTQIWYKPGGDTPETIADGIVNAFRLQLDPDA